MITVRYINEYKCHGYSIIDFISINIPIIYNVLFILLMS